LVDGLAVTKFGKMIRLDKGKVFRGQTLTPENLPLVKTNH